MKPFITKRKGNIAGQINSYPYSPKDAHDSTALAYGFSNWSSDWCLPLS